MRSLASKQIYVTMDQDDDKAPSSHSIKDQCKLRDDLMCRLTEAARATDLDFNNPCTICGVKIQHNFDVLLEFNSDTSTNLFRKHADVILPHLCTSARICPHSFPLIFQFVPCRGDFDPEVAAHIRDIELRVL
jgi:hypothetical protein